MSSFLRMNTFRSIVLNAVIGHKSDDCKKGLARKPLRQSSKKAATKLVQQPKSIVKKSGNLNLISKVSDVAKAGASTSVLSEKEKAGIPMDLQDLQLSNLAIEEGQVAVQEKIATPSVIVTGTNHFALMDLESQDDSQADKEEDNVEVVFQEELVRPNVETKSSLPENPKLGELQQAISALSNDRVLPSSLFSDDCDVGKFSEEQDLFGADPGSWSEGDIEDDSDQEWEPAQGVVSSTKRRGRRTMA
ncbi:OLC1v1018857C1 [Oldenlandia corymbosa var. corymbosa]|uniref:OLC1v1018857C1 n=1 Tax=Oldenlandia corymbosa var. corymbosa TaxID=529605 RepID=A0AAV1ECP1_OLDCO|nr:OLC1v1018857C1 [Oldenlandia corymbosa var. corymbosa]